MSTSAIGPRNGSVDDLRSRGGSHASELRRSTGIGAAGSQYSDIPSDQSPTPPSVLAHAPTGVGGPVTSDVVSRVSTASGIAGNPSAASIDGLALPIGDALGLLAFLMLKSDHQQQEELKTQEDLNHNAVIGEERAGAKKDLDEAQQTKDAGTEGFVLNSAIAGTSIKAAGTAFAQQSNVNELEANASQETEQAGTDLDKAAELRGQAQGNLNEADKLRGQANDLTQEAGKANDEAGKLTREAQDQRALANKATSPAAKAALNRQADQFEARASDKKALAANLTQQATATTAKADAAVAKAADLNKQAASLTTQAKGLRAQAAKDTRTANTRRNIMQHEEKQSSAAGELMGAGANTQRAVGDSGVKTTEAESKKHTAEAEKAKKTRDDLADRKKQIGQDLQQVLAVIEDTLKTGADMVRMHIA